MSDESQGESAVEEGGAIDRRITRRTAIKQVAAGAGVAGVVWAAPHIEGLSLRTSRGECEEEWGKRPAVASHLQLVPIAA